MPAPVIRERVVFVAPVALACALGVALIQWASPFPEPLVLDRRAPREIIVVSARPRPRAPSTELVSSPRDLRATRRLPWTKWDLDEVSVSLSATGPAARFDAGEPREPKDIEAALAERDDLLRRCYRWARFRDARLAATRVSAAMEIDEWGRVRAIAIGGDFLALSRCVDDVLRGLELDRYAPRRTLATGVISFAPSSLGRPLRAPRRPRAPTPRSQIPALIVRQAITLPVDDLVFPVRSIDDYDETQARQEAAARYRLALAAWRSGRGPRPKPEPIVVLCLDSFSGPRAVSMDTIRREIARHLGEVADCYRAASARRPGLSGRVDVHATLSAAGQPLNPSSVVVRSSTLDDRPMEACVADALADLRLPVIPWKEGATELSIPLQFLPDAELPASPPKAPTSCTAQQSTLRELLLASRRVDDEVVEVARALAQTAANDPSCTDATAELLREAAINAHKDGLRRGRRTPIAQAVPLYRIFLGLRPTDASMRFYLAEALFKLGRDAEAAPEYLLVAMVSPRGKHFDEALYAAGVAAREAADDQ
jgi:hypothetical protein